MADIPSFGNTDSTDTGLRSNPKPMGVQGDPNNSVMLAVSRDRRNSSRRWEYINGMWQDATPDGKPINGGITPLTSGSGDLGRDAAEFFDKAASGDWDMVTGKPTAQGQAKLDKAKADAAAKASQDNIAARMQAFIDEMLGPMDTNDPVYRGLMQAGVDAAQKHGGQAGLAGRSTLAGTQAASVAQQNVLPWMAARQQAGQQMLGQLSNRDISLGSLALGQQQVNNGLAESQSNANKNTLATLGAVGGGIIGGIYGGPGGAAAGSQIGGGVMGSLGGGGSSGPSYQQNTWKPGGSYKPSGSGY